MGKSLRILIVEIHGALRHWSAERGAGRVVFAIRSETLDMATALGENLMIEQEFS